MDDDDARDQEGERSLNRIARTLNVPVKSFYGLEQATSSPEPQEADSGEDVALAVMRLFLQLTNPEARARCVAFIAQELTQGG